MTVLENEFMLKIPILLEKQNKTNAEIANLLEKLVEEKKKENEKLDKLLKVYT